MIVIDRPLEGKGCSPSRDFHLRTATSSLPSVPIALVFFFFMQIEDVSIGYILFNARCRVRITR